MGITSGRNKFQTVPFLKFFIKLIDHVGGFQSTNIAMRRAKPKNITPKRRLRSGGQRQIAKPKAVFVEKKNKQYESTKTDNPICQHSPFASQERKLGTCDDIDGEYSTVARNDHSAESAKRFRTADSRLSAQALSNCDR